MKNLVIFSFLIFIISIAFITLVIAAKPDFINADVGNSNWHSNVVIPENAVEVTQGVFDLGDAIDTNGEIVHGYAFIHYKDKKNNVKPSGINSGGTTCYSFLASGAKWKNTEDYYINPTNTQSLSESFIVSSTISGDNQWDNQVSFNVFGNSYINYSASYNNGNLDGVNTLSLGNIAEANVIGVTNVWGIFGGNPKNRKIVEWDMLLDENDFAWGDATIDSSKMDLQNIITHEIGHAAGMGHPNNSCTEETMYAYASNGETKKRDLNSGDIAGIKKLYG